MRDIGKARNGPRESPVFETYFQAREEASRRRVRATEGMIVKIVQSPYGGYVVRSWPVNVLTDPNMRRIVRSHRQPYTAELDG